MDVEAGALDVPLDALRFIDQIPQHIIKREGGLDLADARGGLDLADARGGLDLADAWGGLAGGLALADACGDGERGLDAWGGLDEFFIVHAIEHECIVIRHHGRWLCFEVRRFEVRIFEVRRFVKKI